MKKSILILAAVTGIFLSSCNTKPSTITQSFGQVPSIFTYVDGIPMLATSIGVLYAPEMLNVDDVSDGKCYITSFKIDYSDVTAEGYYKASELAVVASGDRLPANHVDSIDDDYDLPIPTLQALDRMFYNVYFLGYTIKGAESQKFLFEGVFTDDTDDGGRNVTLEVRAKKKEPVVEGSAVDISGFFALDFKPLFDYYLNKGLQTIYVTVKFKSAEDSGGAVYKTLVDKQEVDLSTE